MAQLAIFVTILFTVVLALAVGVGMGFTCVNTILHVMGHRAQAEVAAPALQAAELSGD